MSKKNIAVLGAGKMGLGNCPAFRKQRDIR